MAEETERANWIETELWNFVHGAALNLGLPTEKGATTPQELKLYREMRGAIIACNNAGAGPSAGTPERDELLQQCALNLDVALMELRSIDVVLARRPALGGLETRTEKIERAVATAARYDGLLRQYGTHQNGCMGHPDGVNCRCGWAKIEKELRKGVAGADTPTGPPLFDKPPLCTCGHKARSHGPNWNGESPEKEATGFPVCHYPGCPCLSYCRPLPLDSVLPATPTKEK